MKGAFFIALMLALPVVGRAEDAVLADKFEVTAGMSRTSQSLLRGVLVTYKNDPTLNVNYETAQGFASMQNGVGVWMARDDLFKVGLSVNYMMGRQEKSDLNYWYKNYFIASGNQTINNSEEGRRSVYFLTKIPLNP